jgi:hypothetical protein
MCAVPVSHSPLPMPLEPSVELLLFQEPPKGVPVVSLRRRLFAAGSLRSRAVFRYFLAAAAAFAPFFSICGAAVMKLREIKAPKVPPRTGPLRSP